MKRRARLALAFATLLTAPALRPTPSCAQEDDEETAPAPPATQTTGRTGGGGSRSNSRDSRGGGAVTIGQSIGRTFPQPVSADQDDVNRIIGNNRNQEQQLNSLNPMALTSAPSPTGGGHTTLPRAPYEVGAQGPAMRILAVDKKEPTANMIVGTNHMWNGEHGKALPYFKTSIEGGNTEPRTLTFAALSAYNTGDMELASTWARDARLKDPEGPLSSQAEAIERLSLKRLAAEADPLAPPTRRPGEGRANGARPGESVPELDRPPPPRTAEPGLPPAAVALVAETNRLVAQASKAYRRGDIKEAVKLAGEALLKDPDDVRALQIRAAAVAKAGDWEAARKDAERGLDLAPGYVPLLLLRAAAAAHTKDWESVKADAKAVLAKERANATAWRFAGLAEAALGDRAAASASLSRAAQYGDPEAPRLLAALRALPPGADVVDLVEQLAGSIAEREGASASQSAPAAAPVPKRGRIALVAGAAVLAGLVAGGLILLLGRRNEESA